MRPVDLLSHDRIPRGLTAYDKNPDIPALVVDSNGSIRRIDTGYTAPVIFIDGSPDVDLLACQLFEQSSQVAVIAKSFEGMIDHASTWFGARDLSLGSILHNSDCFSGDVFMGMRLVRSSYIASDVVFVLSDPEFVGVHATHQDQHALIIHNPPAILKFKIV